MPNGHLRLGIVSCKNLHQVIVLWLKVGDHNTKFFHSTTIQRRISNKILGLKGEWIEDEVGIANCLNGYFFDIFQGSLLERHDLLVKWSLLENDNSWIKSGLDLFI